MLLSEGDDHEKGSGMSLSSAKFRAGLDEFETKATITRNPDGVITAHIPIPQLDANLPRAEGGWSLFTGLKKISLEEDAARAEQEVFRATESQFSRLLRMESLEDTTTLFARGEQATLGTTNESLLTYIPAKRREEVENAPPPKETVGDLNILNDDPLSQLGNSGVFLLVTITVLQILTLIIICLFDSIAP